MSDLESRWITIAVSFFGTGLPFYNDHALRIPAGTAVDEVTEHVMARSEHRRIREDLFFYKLNGDHVMPDTILRQDDQLVIFTRLMYCDPGGITIINVD